MTSLFISPHIRRLIDLAIDEDQPGLDYSSLPFFASSHATALLIAKAPLTTAGLDIVPAVFHRVDPNVQWIPFAQDAQHLQPGERLGELRGPALSLLRAERTALNFLQRMCGIATKTHAFVTALNNTKIRLTDTRKTLPAYRELDKYAVLCGGGSNHRFALSGGIMLKDNHIAAAQGDIQRAVSLARAIAPHTLRLEVEVERLDQILPTLHAGAEIIMLDNMDLDTMRQASALIRQHNPHAVIEVSGNVTLDRLPTLGTLDVDVISTGAITHSVEAADISMKIQHHTI